MSAPADRRAEYLATLPKLSRGIVSAALDGAGSPRQAIKAKCLTCTNFDRAEVENCTVITCPLHAFRPYTGEPIRPVRKKSTETADGALGQWSASDNRHGVRGRYARDPIAVVDGRSSGDGEK